MLNKQGPGKIDWTDYTWNPISGCLHNCSYCYVKAMDKRFGSNLMKPDFHPDRMQDLRSKKLNSGDKIFVGSSGDMWGKWVDVFHINDVLVQARNYKDNVFQFLTKNPLKYAEFNLSEFDNLWFGTTFDGTNKTINNIAHLINSVPENLRFVSFEPLLEDPWMIFPHISSLDWIIIGADSTKGVMKPPKMWADHLIECARYYGIPVFVKDNYGYPERVKEFPEI